MKVTEAEELKVKLSVQAGVFGAFCHRWAGRIRNAASRDDLDEIIADLERNASAYGVEANGTVNITIGDKPVN